MQDLSDDLDQFEHLLRRPAWHYQALCRGADPDVYFPRRVTARGAIADCTAKCRDCPVRWDCLESSMVFADDYGIWGGFGGALRNVLRRRLGLMENKPNYDPDAIDGNHLRPDVRVRMIALATKQDSSGVIQTASRGTYGKCA